MIKKWCNSWPWGIIEVILRPITKDNHSAHFLFLTPYLENKQSLHLTGNSSVLICEQFHIPGTSAPHAAPMCSLSPRRLSPTLPSRPFNTGRKLASSAAPDVLSSLAFSLALSLVCLCTWVSPAPYGSWEQGEQWSGSEQKGLRRRAAPECMGRSPVLRTKGLLTSLTVWMEKEGAPQASDLNSFCVSFSPLLPCILFFCCCLFFNSVPKSCLFTNDKIRMCGRIGN